MNDNDVICPQCKTVIGHYVIIKDIALLQMGGGIAYEWHGVCAKCGRGFHWSIKEKLLQEIVEQINSEKCRDK